MRSRVLIMKTLGAVLVVGMCIPAAASGQLSDVGAPVSSVVDRVVAVVGDTALLQSDLQRSIEEFRAGGYTIPEDTAEFEAFTRQVLERRIGDLILVSAAREAGTEVSEEQVNEQVEQHIAQVQREFGSEIAMTNALAESGLTRDQFRQELVAQYRDQQLMSAFLSSRMQFRSRPVINESDVQAFFDSQRATLGQRPATVSFRQVVIRPEPSAEARAAAIAEAEEVLSELRTAADFEVLARRFSDDEGTREHGGDLGWFRTGILLPEVERAAFSMSPGQTSGIVESDLGFHIVRLDRARGAERQARHILIQPEITDADVERARVRADSVLTAVRNGESIATLATRYNSADDEALVTRAVVGQMPAEYIDALSTAPVNELIGPMEISDPRGSRWAVIRLTERTEAGEYTIDDVRDRIVEELQRQAMVEELLAELRDQVYVRILL